MTILSVADLQQLPETDPTPMYVEFGLARCTFTCGESCAATCGRLSCTYTCAVAEQAVSVSEEAVRKAQDQMQSGESPPGFSR